MTDKIRDLTPEQRNKICDYIMNKYCPIQEDGRRHNTWTACKHCPFGVLGDDGYPVCCEYLLDESLSEELTEVLDENKILDLYENIYFNGGYSAVLKKALNDDTIKRIEFKDFGTFVKVQDDNERYWKLVLED